ncbi:MAG: hypothetical protein B7Y90_07405 [Alphaproteobacteria bacterium 32-64-14]|nr:MAG: hypothetical protein B7Y90_07405 [Alphaproteobacteria bacterium 32-64-14]
MSNTCACCGSAVPAAAYGCFACGAARGETPGAPGVCPRCQYRLMQGAKWCPGCDLPADKISFGAPAPQAATAQPSVASDPASTKPARERPPHPPGTGFNFNTLTQGAVTLGNKVVGKQTLILAAAGAVFAIFAVVIVTLQISAQRPPPFGLPPGSPQSAASLNAEAVLLADPIDGQFFLAFKEALPADYTAVMGYLLVQAPDPQRATQRFDKLLGERLEVLRLANASYIASAETSVLDRMADTMLAAMRAPELCQASIDPTGLVDRANTHARRLSSASNTSIVQAIASGRKHQVARPAPTRAQVAAFNAALQRQLYDRQWQAYSGGALASLPPDEQCSVHVGVWDVIASYPPGLSAIWTAQQMGQPAG